jgi:hypothetical protein
MPDSLMDRYQPLGGIRCFHLQGLLAAMRTSYLRGSTFLLRTNLLYTRWTVFDTDNKAQVTPERLNPNFHSEKKNCERPIPNFTEITDLILEKKHTDTDYQSYVNFMHVVQRAHTDMFHMNNHSTSLYPFKALIKHKINTNYRRRVSIFYLQVLVLHRISRTQ